PLLQAVVHSRSTIRGHAGDCAHPACAERTGAVLVKTGHQPLTVTSFTAGPQRRSEPMAVESGRTMSDTIAVRGFAGTDPERRTPPSGTEVTTLRLGSTPRWRDSHTGEWASGSTNWYTVAAFGRLAGNVAESISKGDPIVVVGRPRVRRWENDDGIRSTDVEINAQSVGHDLSFGRTEFSKVTNGSVRSEDHQESTEQDPSHPQSATESPESADPGESADEGQSSGSGVGQAAEAAPDQPAAPDAPPWKGEPQLQRAG